MSSFSVASVASVAMSYATSPLVGTLESWGGATAAWTRLLPLGAGVAAVKGEASTVMSTEPGIAVGGLGGWMHPALPLFLGALLALVLSGRLRQAVVILAPILGFLNLLGTEIGTLVVLPLAGFELQLLEVDKLALIFGYLFHLAALLAGIYALHVDDRVQPSTGLAYAGSAVGAVFAGDFLVLFFFWELLALTSVFQVWARGTEWSLGAGVRYLVQHILSGLLLLGGAAVLYVETGSLELRKLELGALGDVGLAPWLVLLAFGIKAAFPALHSWLVDAYPAATPTGTVFLASFTTKTSVYALARVFAGEGELIVIGSVMAMFPIFYAVIENDLRRVLGYSMINQIGFMVVGIGMGEGLGVNGAVAHAFNDVIFKGLLFMSMGAVLLRTGRINGSELGGLYKTMPQTAGLCMVGAASISAFPGFSGFVSKSMVMAEAAYQGHVVVWLLLLFASAGVFHHAGIKIPFFAFYAHDSGLRPKEAPLNMRVAMGISAVLCILIGCMPTLLYRLLPYDAPYNPYDVTHVVTQLQVLFFSALAFVTLMLTKVYPPELPSTNLDVDWLWRRMIPAVAGPPVRAASVVWSGTLAGLVDLRRTLVRAVGWLHAPGGRFGTPWSTGKTAFWATLLLAVMLLIAYAGR